MLGPPRFLAEEIAERTKEPGVAIGLAWTPAGGDILFIEATRMHGSGELTLTGQLGDVMKESARAALSYVRRTRAVGSIRLLRARRDPHPRALGRDPQGRPVGRHHDGHRAGLGADGRPVRDDIAMTGEITLSGRVLPIGGIKEKVLAARRVGIRRVILPPHNNEKSVLGKFREKLRKKISIPTFFY